MHHDPGDTCCAVPSVWWVSSHILVEMMILCLTPTSLWRNSCWKDTGQHSASDASDARNGRSADALPICVNQQALQLVLSRCVHSVVPFVC
jgi:hypothetical protein